MEWLDEVVHGVGGDPRPWVNGRVWSRRDLVEFSRMIKYLEFCKPNRKRFELIVRQSDGTYSSISLISSFGTYRPISTVRAVHLTCRFFAIIRDAWNAPCKVAVASLRESRLQIQHMRPGVFALEVAQKTSYCRNPAWFRCFESYPGILHDF